MSNNPYKESKFARFVSGKGFYVILAACIIGMAAAAVVSDMNSNEIPLEEESLPPAVSIKQKDVKKEKSIAAGPEILEEKEYRTHRVSKPDNAQKVDEPKEVPVEAATYKASFVMPVEGEIITVFSEGELIKDETMGDWRTHNGIDIAAREYSPIVASAPGKVKRVYNDALWGNVVEIEHPGSIVTRYCGLTPQVLVEEENTVKAGQKIGELGLVPVESKLPGHLHFETIKQGKYVNPLSLMK